MKYSEITYRMFNQFNISGENFPYKLLLPMYVKMNNSIYDMFIELDQDNNEEIKLVYFQNINNEEENIFIKKDQVEKLFSKTKHENKKQIFPRFLDENEHFSTIYENVRSFVFSENLNDYQQKEIIKLYNYYDEVLTDNIRNLYELLGSSFFEWINFIFYKDDK